MKLLKLSIIFLTILLFANVVTAKVIPPIPEKSNLVFRYGLDTLINGSLLSNFESGWDGWTAYRYSSYGWWYNPPLPSRTTEWASSGNYSVKMNMSIHGHNNYEEDLIFKAGIYSNLNITQGWIDFDLNISEIGTDAHEEFRVIVNNTIVYTASSVGEYHIHINLTNVNSIKLEIYACVPGGADADIDSKVYVDNITVISLVNDDSANGHHGILYGVNSTQARYQYGLQFNGGNITTLDNFTLTNFTITAWVNFSNDVWHLLYAKNDTCGISIFYGYSSLQGRTYAGSSSPSSAFSDDRLTKNQWHFVAITGRYDPNNQRLYVKIYIDAEWDGSEYVCDYIPATVQLVLFKDLQGVVDEIRLWNKELTQSDIQDMYEAMRIKAYNEMNVTEVIYPLNLTIQSSYQVVPQFDEINKVVVVFYSNITEGEWFITASSENYAKRTVSITITNDYELHEINIYLPPSSQTITVLFTLKDYTNRFSDKPKLIVKKALPSGLAVMASQYFDTGLQTYVNLVSGELYQLYVSNGVEMRSVGYYSSTVSTSAVIIVGNLTIVPVTYGGAVQFNYTYDAKNQTLYFNYITVDGITTYTNLTIYNESGSIVYYAESTEPNGAYTVLNLSNTTNYWIEFYVVNSLGVIHFKQMLAVTSKKIGISIPPTIGNILFIGLAILVVLMSTAFSLPIGLIIATGILAFATMNGWTTLPTSLIWGIVVITAVSFFIQKRGVSEL